MHTPSKHDKFLEDLDVKAILGQDSIYVQVPINSYVQFSVLTSLARGQWDRRITVFPQPAQGTLTLRTTQSSISAANGEVELLTILGQVVKTQPLPFGTQELSIPVNDLPAGPYLLRLKAGHLFSQRVVTIR